jgi:uncharacterized protein (TIGR02453 family)
VSFFSADALRFLKSLARNNRREWFELHRENWLRDVRDPMAELVEDLDLRLRTFAPEITGDPKRSIFRIYRDVRFSADKSPYKTHAACWFFHTGGSSKVGREAHGGGAGFYFHLQPGASFVGGGCWMPPRPALARIRAALAADIRGFERIVKAPALRRRMGGLGEESMLTRVPRGYPADHPAATWLRHQSFTVGRKLSDADVTSARLATALASDFKAITPLVRWINSALGLEPHDSR